MRLFNEIVINLGYHMKSETQSVTVVINKKDALSIYNALNNSTNAMEPVNSETKGAHDLRDILRGNFFSQMQGVHKV